jgi:hypothetical protein
MLLAHDFFVTRLEPVGSNGQRGNTATNGAEFGSGKGQ